MALPHPIPPTKRRVTILAVLCFLVGWTRQGRADASLTPVDASPPSAPSAPMRVGSPFLQPDPPPLKALPVDADAPHVISEIPHQEFEPSLVDAILADDGELVKTLLDAGVPARSVAVNGETPLCAALRSGRADLALLLLMHGADANAPGLEGHPPIALASLRRHPQLIRVLLAAGADPNKTFVAPHSKALLSLVTDDFVRDEMKHERNLTPLMVCSARGDVEAVTLLMKWGANKEKHTLPHYRSAINMAADQHYLYVMRILLGRNPEREPHVLITVDLSRQRATLAVDGEMKVETSISTGRAGYSTPAGRYVITNKYKNWTSTLYDCPMPWFMRLNCGSFGLHSGYVTGRPESHGCIRLPHEMAKKFFSMTNVGDEVNIER
jgi:ankyrin repeat protein